MDRGALDAALKASFPCGGWCPEGRKAEDGPIHPRYPMTVLPGAGYRQRTRQNVVDSDGTLVIHFGTLSGGTRETVRFCERFGKPALVVDGNATDPNAIAEQTAGFLCEHSISVLNVAGPRESQSPGARAYSEAVIKTLLQHLREELWSRN